MIKGLLTLLLAANTQGFDKALGRSGKQLKGFRAVVATATKAMGFFGGAFLIVNTIRNVTNTIIAFDKAMVGLSAILGTTRVGMANLEKQAISLGGKTIFTANQIGDLQTTLARFGFDSREIEASTEAITNLAAAAGIDLVTAADTGAATLRAFQLDASEMGRVADVMTNAFTKSALTVESFADAMTYAAPVASSAGAELEETAAMLAILADNGIRGSIAGTGLRRMFTNLAKDGKTMTESLMEANAIIEANGDAVAYAKQQVGQFALAPFLILARNAGALGEVVGEMGELGTASQVASTQLESISAKILLMESAWNGFILSVDSGQGTMSNFMKSAIDDATSLLNLMAGLGDEVEKLTVKQAIGRVVWERTGGTALNWIKDSFDALTAQGRAAGIVRDAIAEAEKATRLYNEEQARLQAPKMWETYSDGIMGVVQSTEFWAEEQKKLNAIITGNQVAQGEEFDKQQAEYRKAFQAQEDALYRIYERYVEIDGVIEKIVQKSLKMKPLNEMFPALAGMESIGLDGYQVPTKAGKGIKTDEAVMPEKSFTELIADAERLAEANLAVANSYLEIGRALGSAFEQGFSDMRSLAQDTLGILIDIAAQYAITAAMAAIGIATETAAAAGPLGLLVLPAAIALAAGMVKGAINTALSTTPRAMSQGGIAYDTTYAMVGEYGSSRSNPEVVAPLDRLKSILGDVGGGGYVTGELILKNRTLVAALNRETNRQNRYGGNR